MPPEPMYSANWFEAFAAKAEEPTSLEIAAIGRICPLPEFGRLLEIGCGTGRVAEPLASIGYEVVGIDVNEAALQIARTQAPGPEYIALDQRDVAQLDRTFDAVIVLWNSVGFRTRDHDELMLRDVTKVLRAGGKLLIDLYHPEWLLDQPIVAVNTRGTSVRRWVNAGRCFHEIIYANGHTDHIQFNVYTPEEMGEMLTRVGFVVQSRMTWWSTERAPDRTCARYQLECVLPAALSTLPRATFA